MPTAEITIGYVNQPKPGKRMGSLKAGDEYYGCAPNMLGMFKVGETCTIEFDESPKDGGGTWKNVKRKVSTSAAAIIPPLRNRTNPEDSKQMFVTALLKEGIATGNVGLSTTEIVAVGNALKEAYDHLFGTTTRQTTEAAMDDKVPY